MLSDHTLFFWLSQDLNTVWHIQVDMWYQSSGPWNAKPMGMNNPTGPGGTMRVGTKWVYIAPLWISASWEGGQGVTLVFRWAVTAKKEPGNQMLFPFWSFLLHLPPPCVCSQRMPWCAMEGLIKDEGASESASLTGMVVMPRHHPNYGQGTCSLYPGAWNLRDTY